MAAGYKDINTAKTVVGTLQKWPTKAGGRSHKGQAMAGTTVASLNKIFHIKTVVNYTDTDDVMRNTVIK